MSTPKNPTYNLFSEDVTKETKEDQQKPAEITFCSGYSDDDVKSKLNTKKLTWTKN
jgi:hypothetical protein